MLDFFVIDESKHFEKFANFNVRKSNEKLYSTKFVMLSSLSKEKRTPYLIKIERR